jgi:hypothetical protein
MLPQIPSRMRFVLLAVSLGFGASAEAQRAPERGDRPPAQEPTVRAARFFGTIVDAATQLPIAGARVASPSVVGVVVSDSAGRFSVPNVPPGLVRFHVVASGFPRSSFVLPFASGEEMERMLELDSSSVAPPQSAPAQGLPAVQVDATPLPPVGLRDFERRRTTGRGQYVTGDEIERRGYNRLTDIVQVMRGVTVDCGGGGSGCRIRMVRAPMQCYPDYWIDGQLNNDWGPSVNVRDIEGLEVYTGPTDTPGEFAGERGHCGAIVIWTGTGIRNRRP